MSSFKALLVSEGSGGHLIPALQAAMSLAQAGAEVTVWYAQRAKYEELAKSLVKSALERKIGIKPVALKSGSNMFARLLQYASVWRMTRQGFSLVSPDVVVGFGGWISIPALITARRRRIRCMLHEQNVLLGRANRYLVRFVDCVAVSFKDTQRQLHGKPSIVTGMPVRHAIGRATREQAAARFGLDAERVTLLVLGGSQGARFINQIVIELISDLTQRELNSWQILHMSGVADQHKVSCAYAKRDIKARVASFFTEMELAYAMADIAIARAGSSTIAELSICGIPAILIPYRHAGGHQHANAKIVDEAGSGIVIREADARSGQLLEAIRYLMANDWFRRRMGEKMRALAIPDATERLSNAIIDLVALRSARREEAKGCESATGNLQAATSRYVGVNGN